MRALDAVLLLTTMTACSATETRTSAPDGTAQAEDAPPTVATTAPASTTSTYESKPCGFQVTFPAKHEEQSQSSVVPDVGPTDVHMARVKRAGEIYVATCTVMTPPNGQRIDDSAVTTACEGFLRDAGEKGSIKPITLGGRRGCEVTLASHPPGAASARFYKVENRFSSILVGPGVAASDATAFMESFRFAD